MTSRLYAYADVGRTGLGNMLLPWARCEIFRHEHQVPMLAPRWTQPKIGPVLRREQDKRFYVGLFNTTGYLRGLARLRVWLTARRIPEQDFASAAPAENGKTLVVFSGLGDMFAPLLGHRQLLRNRLMEILSANTRQRLAECPNDFVIGAHVRRGDKPVIEFGQLQTGANQGMPDRWFIACIQELRKTLGYAAPVKIFSDARPPELAALLALPSVTLAPRNPAIVDILALARSRILLTSAHSTFSLWASYLGEMPTLWYPGGMPGLLPHKPGHEAETDLEGHFKEGFAQLIQNIKIPSVNP